MPDDNGDYFFTRSYSDYYILKNNNNYYALNENFYLYSEYTTVYSSAGDESVRLYTKSGNSYNSSGYVLPIGQRFNLECQHSIKAVYEHDITPFHSIVDPVNSNGEYINSNKGCWNIRGVGQELGVEMVFVPDYMDNNDKKDLYYGESEQQKNAFIYYEPTTTYDYHFVEHFQTKKQLVNENNPLDVVYDTTYAPQSGVANEKAYIDKRYYADSSGWVEMFQNMPKIPGFTAVNITGASAKDTTNPDKCIYNDKDYLNNDITGTELEAVKALRNGITTQIPYSSTNTNARVSAYKKTDSSTDYDRYTDFYYMRNTYTIHLCDSMNLDQEDYISFNIKYDCPPPASIVSPDRTVKLQFLQAINNNVYFGTPAITADNKVVVYKTVTTGNVTRKYKFGGFYLDPMCQDEDGNSTQVFTEELYPTPGSPFETMPARDVYIFAKWDEVEYKVDIDPNYGQLSSTESTYFGLRFDETIQEYRDISRPYIEAKTSEINSLTDENKYYYIKTSRPASEGDYSNDRRAVYVSAADYAANTSINGIPIRNYTFNGKTYSYDISNDPRLLKNSVTGAPVIFKKDPGVGEGENKVDTYKLVGWFKNDNGKLSLYNFDTLVEQDTALTVMWQSNNKYVVKYDANEYETDGKTIKYHGHLKDGNETVYDSKTENEVTKKLTYAEGASALVKYAAIAGDENPRAQFIYWTIDGDSSQRHYSINETFVITPEIATEEDDGAGNTLNVIRLVAHYSILQQVGIRYNRNAIENDTTQSGVVYYPNNSAITLHNATQDGFTNGNQVIKGWSNMPDSTAADAKIYKLGGSYGLDDVGTENTDGVTTLYAVWDNSAAVTFNTKGGTWGTLPSNISLTDSGSAYTGTVSKSNGVPEPNTAPTSDGKVFKFWTTDSNPTSSSTKYEFDKSLTEDVQLYAYYEVESSAVTSRNKIDVRYFYMETNGNITEKFANDYLTDGFWYSSNWVGNYELNGITSEPTDIFENIESNTSNNIIYYLKDDDGPNIIATGIGSSSGTNVYAVKMLNNGLAFDNNDLLVGGSYIKFATGDNDINWSSEKDGTYQLYNDNPCVYVIIMDSDSKYTYKNVTVSNSVTGSGYSAFDEFEYTATIKNGDGTTAGTETFKLTPNSSRTISLLTNTSDSTKNQTVTVTQTKVPTISGGNYAFTNITQTGSTPTGNSIELSYDSDVPTFNNTYTALTTTTPKPLTITNTLFDKSNTTGYPSGTAAYNADGKSGNTPTVGVRVVDSQGNFHADLDGIEYLDNGQIKLDASQLEQYKTGGYKLEITLGVQNTTDSTVSSAKTYVETGENSKGAVDTTITDKNNIAWSKSSSGDGVITCDISSLFSGDDLKANTLNFTTQAKTEMITIVYKYYDRTFDTNVSKALDISEGVSTVTKTAKLGSATDKSGNAIGNIDRVGDAITANMPNVRNVLDEINFFTTQFAAYDALTSSAANRVALQPVETYTSAYTSDGAATHTDRYGKPIIDGEKWVTYNNANKSGVDKSVALTNATENISDDIYTVTEVVVWGFNVPRKYSVQYVIPNDESEMTVPFTNANNETVFFADETTRAATNPVSYYYNQRVGAMVGTNDNDPRNGASDYLKNYNLDFNSNHNDAPVLPQTESKQFDGWYVKEGDNYIKVASDEQYGERITKDIKLYAGYTETESEDKGFTLTKNAVETCADKQGNLNYRYVTMLNSYGYENNATSLNHAALLYVVLPSDVRVDDIPDISTILVAGNDSTEYMQTNHTNQQELTAAVAANLNGNAFGASTVVPSNQQGYYIFNEAATKYNTVGYAYTIVREDTTASSEVQFTNKNRSQFTLSMDGTKVEEGGTYSKLLVLGAVDVNGIWKFSDNYILYVNGE